MNPKIPFKYHFSKKLIRGAYVRTLLLAVVLLATSSAIILNERSQDLRRQAAGSNPISIIVDPNTSTLQANSSELVTIWMRINHEMSLDAVQYELTVNGVDANRIQLQTNELIPNATSVIRNSGTTFKVAYVSDDPARPYVLPPQDLIMIGRLRINTPSSGQVTLSFNNGNTDAFETGNGNDVFNDIQPLTFNIGTTNYASAITHMDLVDVSSRQIIRTLSDGDTINVNDYPPFTIEAHGTGSVDSVKFEYDNGQTTVENTAPYTLAGNDGANYKRWQPGIGSTKVTATSYSNDGAGGTKGKELSLQLYITDQDDPWRITGLNLVDTDNGNRIIQALSGETLIDLSSLPQNFTIEALVTEPTQSVKFNVNGSARIENLAPYVYTGNTDDNFSPWDLAAGTYQMTVTPYSRDGATGEAGPSITTTLNVVNQASSGNATRNSTSNSGSGATRSSTGSSGTQSETTPVQQASNIRLVLVNADNGQAIRTLSSGDTIDKSQVGNINVRLDGYGSNTRSVKFEYAGATSIENATPYALASDNNGSYFDWNPNTGNMTIKATTYSDFNAEGTVLESTTVNISITESVDNNLKLVLINANNGQDIKTLSNNETISKGQYNNSINIRANNLPSGTESVVFESPDGQRRENGAPYTLAGDFLGIIYRWRPNNGTITVKATAYSQDNGQGSNLGSTTLNLRIVD